MYPSIRSDIYEREQKIQSQEKIITDLTVQNETMIKQINEKDLKILKLEKDVNALRLNMAFQNSNQKNNVEEDIERRDRIIQTLKSALEEKSEELLRANSNLSALKQENDERQERIFSLSGELSRKTEEIENTNQKISIPPRQKMFVNIVKPPKQVTNLHDTVVESISLLKIHSLQQILPLISGLQTEAEMKGFSLWNSEEGPALVTIVNSSRIVSDITRDLARIKGWLNCGSHL